MCPFPSTACRPARLGLLVTALAVSTMWVLATPAAAADGSIAGTVFVDANRDALRHSGEAAMADQRIYLFDAAGSYLANRVTDATGAYTFGALPAGSYRVEVQAAPLRSDWVPTTTASLFPRTDGTVSGATTVDFGFRRIARSTDVAAPMSAYTGPNGLTTASYNDVVTARQLYDAVLRGTVGPEAGTVTIRFDLAANSTTTHSVTSSDGRYSNFSATVYVTYPSWLDHGDYILSHEYGHAWSMYHAYLTQQDPTLRGYLAARGLTGDPRLNSSHSWNVDELIAEDYRTLLGSASAAAIAQENSDIPAAADVAGLKEYLRDTFTVAAPAPAPSPEPTVSPSPSPSPSPTPTSAPSKATKTGGGKGGGTKR